MDEVIRLVNVSKIYDADKKRVEALKKVSISIRRGEMVGIVGESGAGKSTLLSIVGLLTERTEGEYILLGKNIEEYTDKELCRIRNKSLGYVLQEYGLVDYMTVSENVELPLLYGAPKETARSRRERVQEILSQLGIEDKIDTKVSKLSGGQKQRVAIARALVNRPEIILADEPTASLDEKTKAAMVELLIETAQKDNTTLVLVTHDADVSNKLGRIISLCQGTVTEN